MKTKKLNKKLVLKKESIANLNLEEMREVRGGDYMNTIIDSCLVTICVNSQCSIDGPVCIYTAPP